MIPWNSIIQLFQPLTLASFVACLGIAAFHQPALANPGLSNEPIIVTLKDFQIHTSITQAKSGGLTFKAVNEGKNIHECLSLTVEDARKNYASTCGLDIENKILNKTYVYSNSLYKIEKTFKNIYPNQIYKTKKFENTLKKINYETN